MSSRLYLHVGSPKTGTTFLQQVLWSQRDVVREQGVLLPGRAFNDHWLACMDLRGRAEDVPQSEGAWSALVEELVSWRGDALVSHELFAGLVDDEIERAVTDLSRACDELHVVITARDMARQIPAEWQEHLKHRSTVELEQFLENVRTRGPDARWFWRVQDVPALARRWADRIGAERVHVVTVPPSGSDPALLWGRFATTVGLRPEDFSLEVRHANSSVGLEQAELLRRLNAELGDRLSARGSYSVLVKDQLAHQMLALRPGTKIELPKEDFEFAVAHGGEVVEQLAALGVDVVGEPQELVPRGAATSSEVPHVTADEVLEEAVAALASTLQSLETTRAQLRRARAAQGPPPIDPEVNPVRRGLVALSRRSRTVDAAKRAYKGLVRREGAGDG